MRCVFFFCFFCKIGEFQWSLLAWLHLMDICCRDSRMASMHAQTHIHTCAHTIWPNIFRCIGWLTKNINSYECACAIEYVYMCIISHICLHIYVPIDITQISIDSLSFLLEMSLLKNFLIKQKIISFPVRNFRFSYFKSKNLQKIKLSLGPLKLGLQSGFEIRSQPSEALIESISCCCT